jgi:hypothetical protein
MIRERPKLLQDVRDLIRTLPYGYRTEETYLCWIRRYIIFAVRYPAEMGPAQVGNPCVSRFSGPDWRRPSR